MAKWTDVKTLARAVLTMLVASCSPASSGDDVVDSTVDTAPMAREVTLQCMPIAVVTVRFSNGTGVRSTHWYATLEQPYDWARVQARVCNLTPAPSDCPIGTCTGTPPPTARCTVVNMQIVEYDGPARVPCGVVSEDLDAAGNVTNPGGPHYAQATVRIE